MKNYETPAIKTVSSLSFETVCAGSGTGVCPKGKSEIEAASLDCQLCIDTRKPWQDYFDAAGGNNQEGRIKGVYAAVETVGYCPGGLSNIV